MHGLIRSILVPVVLTGCLTQVDAQTGLPNNLEINLLPGYVHQPLQGIDSIVGKLTKKGGPDVLYEIGGIPKPGLPALSGHFFNQAEKQPANNLQWRKKQKIGGRIVHVAYTKKQRLMVSTAFKKIGVNFSTEARSSEEVAEILLMVLTLEEKKSKK